MKELKIKGLEDVNLTIGPVSIDFKKDQVIHVNQLGMGTDEFYNSAEAINMVRTGKLSVVLEDDDLRIWRILSPLVNPLKVDFTILGFRKISPNYDRGRKVKAEYRCIATGDLVIEKVFTDKIDISTGRVSGLEITFNWYKQDGSIGITKTEEVKEYNRFESETLQRRRREKQLDYLVGSAKGTPIEPYVGVVFASFAVQEQKYITHASPDLAQDLSAAMQDDSPENAQLYSILNIDVPRNDSPTQTIKLGDSILYQIGAKTLAEV